MKFQSEHSLANIDTADGDVESPPLRALSALYRHGSRTELWDGQTLFRFREKEWSVARRKTRLRRRDREAFVVMNKCGVPVRSGYDSTPSLRLYLEAASSCARRKLEV